MVLTHDFVQGAGPQPGRQRRPPPQPLGRSRIEQVPSHAVTLRAQPAVELRLLSGSLTIHTNETTTANVTAPSDRMDSVTVTMSLVEW